MKKKLGIKVLSSSCGVLPHTIRTWEKRYNVFEPERNDLGQRLYSEEDLAKAKLLVKLIGHGHSISSIAPLTYDELEEMAIGYSEAYKSDSEKNLDFKPTTKSLLRQLKKFDLESIKKELIYLRTSMGAREFIFSITLPVMQEIGRLVEQDIYSITQEHIISTMIRDELSKFVFPIEGNKTMRMILATPEGNIHELSINIAEILCKAARLTTYFLGASHPASSLAEAINSLDCDYLVLGVISSDDWNYGEHIAPFVEGIDKHLTRKVKIILGGGAKLKLPKLNYVEEVINMSTLEEFDDFLRRF